MAALRPTGKLAPAKWTEQQRDQIESMSKEIFKET
jgi:hypothetical protein